MEKVFVKPVEGKRCKDPRSNLVLPERGKYVPKNSYWLRRVSDGDCVVAMDDRAVVSMKKVKRSKKSDLVVESDLLSSDLINPTTQGMEVDL